MDHIFKTSQKPLLKFGVLTDLQYSTAPDRQDRHYSLSHGRLVEALSHWKTLDPCHSNLQGKADFVIHLGDIIDGNINEELAKEELSIILQTLNSHQIDGVKFYHVIGNNCLSASREHLMKELRMEKNYFDFVIGSWRIIVLDSTDLSVLGHNPDRNSPLYIQAEKYLRDHPKSEYPWSREWNCGISEAQLEWLAITLQKCRENEERVIIFCHNPLVPDPKIERMERYLAWNHKELLNIMDQYSPDVVAMLMNGHYHPGGYCLRNGVHHVTVPAVLTSPIGTNSFGCVQVYSDRIELTGHGTLFPTKTLDIWHK